MMGAERITHDEHYMSIITLILRAVKFTECIRGHPSWGGGQAKATGLFESMREGG